MLISNNLLKVPFNFLFQDGDDAEPVLKLSHSCGESITAVEGGIVGTAGYEEVVAATYTGKVFRVPEWHTYMPLVEV